MEHKSEPFRRLPGHRHDARQSDPERSERICFETHRG